MSDSHFLFGVFFKDCIRFASLVNGTPANVLPLKVDFCQVALNTMDKQSCYLLDFMAFSNTIVDKKKWTNLIFSPIDDEKVFNWGYFYHVHNLQPQI